MKVRRGGEAEDDLILDTEATETAVGEQDIEGGDFGEDVFGGLGFAGAEGDQLRILKVDQDRSVATLEA